MKVEALLLIGASLLAFIHQEAAPLITAAFLIWWSVRVEQKRRKKRRHSTLYR